MGRVYQHELGRRHTLNMQATFGRKRVESEDETQVPEQNAVLEVAPGEPVPPGFEDMDRKAIIQVWIALLISKIVLKKVVLV